MRYLILFMLLLTGFMVGTNFAALKEEPEEFIRFSNLFYSIIIWVVLVVIDFKYTALIG